MSEILNIGSRREVFWDDYLIDKEKTTTEKRVCPVNNKQTVTEIDDNVISYPTICKVGDKYRIYYVGGWVEDGGHTDNTDIWHLGVKVMTSTDGINWDFPKVNGRNDNVTIEKILDNIFVYRDTNPDCPEDELYKAVGSGKYFEGKYGLYLFTSADGYDFKVARFITDKGAFDTCNTLHYIDGKYVCYVRSYHEYKAPANETDCMMNDLYHIPTPGKNARMMRSICVLYSDDCVSWSDPEEIIYDDDMDHQMYTNNAMIYERAPHIMIGFPTRYCERLKWTENYDQLGGRERRWKEYKGPSPREGLTTTDCLFMCSRDTKHWTRYNEAFMSPGYETEQNWVYGDCYPAFGFIDSGREYYMMYSTGFHHERAHGVKKPLYMHKVRKDGFACQCAGGEERVLVTKPLIFEGNELHLNFETSAYGYIIVDVLDEDGNKLSEGQSFEVFGNNIDRRVMFEDGSGFSAYANKPVRLRFRMRDAKVYSVKFER